MRGPELRLRLLSFVVAALASGAAAQEAPVVGPAKDGRCPLTPRFRVTPAADKALEFLHAKRDRFPEEAVHEEIRPRIDALQAALKGLPKAAAGLPALLAADFRGGRLTPSAEALL